MVMISKVEIYLDPARLYFAARTPPIRHPRGGEGLFNNSAMSYVNQCSVFSLDGPQQIDRNGFLPSRE